MLGASVTQLTGLLETCLFWFVVCSRPANWSESHVRQLLTKQNRPYAQENILFSGLMQQACALLEGWIKISHILCSFKHFHNRDKYRPTQNQKNTHNFHPVPLTWHNGRQNCVLGYKQKHNRSAEYHIDCCTRNMLQRIQVKHKNTHRS